jgi:Fe-S cluster assembly protein SufD
MLLEHSKQNLSILGATLPAWSLQARVDALASVESTGLPTGKLEEWRYSDPTALFNQDFSNNPGSQTETQGSQHIEGAIHISFIDGQLQADNAALPTGISLSAIDDQAFAAPPALGDLTSLHTLNRALFTGGLRLTIAPSAIIEQPIVITQHTSGPGCKTALQPRVMIECGKSSQASILFVSSSTDAAKLVNTSVQLILNENATLEWLASEQLHTQSNHCLAFSADLHRDATLFTHTVDEGCAYSRHDVVINLLGNNADVSLNGAVIGQGNIHTDHHTTIHHHHAHCTSNQLFKGILSDKAVKVYNGKVIVHKDAQKTDSSQYNYNLLLDDGAVVNTKPELEIYADDVKCAHGATSGQLDETIVNYIRCRGIDKKSAEQMLSSAFIFEVAEKIQNEKLFAYANQRIQRSLDSQLRRRNS